ncbi:MAG: transposase, partial [Pseudomonadota bacterium]
MPQPYDKELYKKRNLVERFFGRLKKSFRRIATRYEKSVKNFMALIKLASIRLWCEFYESTT